MVYTCATRTVSGAVEGIQPDVLKFDTPGSGYLINLYFETNILHKLSFFLFFFWVRIFAPALDYACFHGTPQAGIG